MAGGLLRNDPLWEAVDRFKSHNPELPILCDPSHISGDRRLLREIVEEALEIALQAPTGSNRQGWHWVFVEDQAGRVDPGERMRCVRGRG